MGANDPDLNFELAQALLGAGRDQKAVSELSTSQRRHVAHLPTLKLLSTLLYRAGQIDDVRQLLGDAVFRLGVTPRSRELLEHWQALLPHDAVPQHRLAALRGEDVPERAADGYVTYLFDRYADYFDTSLAKLNYQAPALVAQQLREFAVLPTGQWQVLDAGCGTGLCASIARPFARHLTGVDLSASMVAKARERGGYDDLVVAEITDYLLRGPAQFDLIVSADTLNYFGDLNGVFKAAAHALRPGGWFAFTLEAINDNDTEGEHASGYCLHGHGRYSHASAYVTHTLAASGLIMRASTVAALRKEGDKPVPGSVILAQLADSVAV